jgi:uncharacterized protein (TIGR03435 family)
MKRRREMQRARALWLSVVAVSTLISTLPGALAQASKPAAVSDRKLEFAVASVKENRSQEKPTSNVTLDRSDTYSPNGGTFAATNQPLIAYLIFAYKIEVSEFRDGLMSRLPPWAVTDKFDIVAKAESQSPTKDELRSMMQSVLEDRFQLKVHREKREVSIFGLYLVKPGKLGSQLKQHDPTSNCSAALPVLASSAAISTLVGVWPPTCGDGLQIWHAPRFQRSGGRNMSMDAIASWLTGACDFDLLIQDRTALSGTYDFAMQFEHEHPEGASADSAPFEGPTCGDAMRDQLGLQLKKEKGVNSIFVVDQVEYPSAN